MSIHSVKQYQSEVEKIIHFKGTKKETAIRAALSTSASATNSTKAIAEFAPTGEPVLCPYKSGNNRKEEIASRLFDGDWRIYSQK